MDDEDDVRMSVALVTGAATLVTETTGPLLRVETTGRWWHREPGPELRHSALGPACQPEGRGSNSL